MKKATHFKRTMVILLAAVLSILPVFPALAEESGMLVDPQTAWAQYDALIDQIRNESDLAAREELMHDAEDMLMATWCVIPVCYYSGGFVLQDGMNGIYRNVRDVMYMMYAETAGDTDMLTSYMGWGFYSMDPHAASYSEDFTVAANLFSGLYTYDSEGNVVPACAEGYPVTENGYTYTITLKEGLKWSDGTDLTAGDFMYSWQRAAYGFFDYNFLFALLNGDNNGEITDLQVTALDDRTLTFTLSVPAPTALIAELLTMPVFYPVPRNYVETYATAEDPSIWSTFSGFPSNGAYSLAELDEYGNITLVKNPYWYDADRVSVEKQKFLYNPDSDEMIIAAFQDGSVGCINLDVVSEQSSLQVLTEGHDQALHVQMSMGIQYLGVNCQSSLFADKTAEQAAAMRHAFSILLDRDKFCRSIGLGLMIPAASLIPTCMSDLNGGVFESEGYYDPYLINQDPDAAIQQARTLLESAGYVFGEDGMLSPDTPITFRITVPQGQEDYASLFSEDLSRIGIVTEVIGEEWSTFAQTIDSGDFDLLRRGWLCDSNDPLEILEVFTSYSSGNYLRLGK